MKRIPKLLIVDDDKAICKQLKWAFSEDYEVKICEGDEDELRDLLQDFHPDLITLDVNLSGVHSGREGLSLLPMILKTEPMVKVIMITASDSKELALEAISKGAYDFYVKPINIEELSIILRRAFYIKQLEEELMAMRQTTDLSFMGILGKSPKMQEVFSLLQTVAPSDFTVLITGESGTGKELVARAIHKLSNRRDKPFVVVNCGAIPENLLESELFGHKRGAFTGAVSDKKGRFEVANEGTVFLDEIGELPLNLQVKLLRVLQEKVIQPVGSHKDIHLDIRIIAATNADLKEEVEKGNFREDLYYRLNVINIFLPPLRDRGEDILLLAQHFINVFSKQLGKTIRGISPEAIRKLLTYTWPGNVRELENVMLRAVILCSSGVITDREIMLEGLKERNYLGFELPDSIKLAKEKVERLLIKRALKKCNGNISHAARILEISRPQLYQLMEKYGIK